jgi:maltose/moltooligosaccharide transporter
MGIFNFFIVLPEIIASLGFKGIMKNVLHNDRMLAIQVGGVLLIFAAILCYLLVKETQKGSEEETIKLEMEEQRSV